MKRIVLSIAFLLASSPLFAADKTYGQKVGTTDTLVNLNYRDRDGGGTSWAPTVNSEANFTYSNFTSTTNVKTSAGLLHSVVVNTAAAQTITIYDSNATCSGTKIASLPASAVVGTYTYDVQFLTGLSVCVPASGPDVTVSYR